MKKSTFIIVLNLLVMSLSAADVVVTVTKCGEEEVCGDCQNGGARIDIVTDEVLSSTQYVCNGVDGSVSGVSVSEEPVGGSCKDRGGIKVTAGSTSYICNGADGKSAMSQISEDTDGHCFNGGIKIEAGIDLNDDGILVGDEEIKVTDYACNGVDGNDGKDSITKVSEEPKGDNCQKSDGIKIEAGIDDNGNGELDEGEVKSVNYVCNGKNGIRGNDGPAGETGPSGENGTDGKDGEQGDKGDQGPKGDQGEQGETGATGEAGKNGSTSLVSVVEEPKGENCASGGKKIEIGLDANENGVLDEDEIDSESIYYVCNGLDAEESGLTSSSTGCSVSAVDETDNVFAVFFAIVSMFCAFAEVIFARS